MAINENSYRPLVNNPEAFQIDALGPNLRRLIEDIHRLTQTPISAVASMVIVAISLICQGRVRVRNFRSGHSPVSLWFILIMESGERKTALIECIFKEVMKFIHNKREEHSKKIKVHEAHLAAWSSVNKGINDRLREKARNGYVTDGELEEARAHALIKPNRPKGFKLVFENTSPTGIVKGLFKNHPTAAILSPEASNIFNSKALSDFGLLNICWESGTIFHDRGNESFTVTDPCLTLAILSQENVATNFFQTKNILARSSGFLARCYYLKPLPMAGNRPFDKSLGESTYSINCFYQRCAQILESHLDENGEFISEKETLEFSHEAQERWYQEYNLIEGMMAPGGYYANAKDFASKQANKIARLSALLHYFDGTTGAISLSYMENAITLSDWFAQETMNNIMPQNDGQIENIDAENLEDWLARYFYRTGSQTIAKNDILRHGPNSIRKKDRLDKALDILMSDERVVEDKLPGERVVRVFLHNDYFQRLIHYKLSSGELGA